MRIQVHLSTAHQNLMIHINDLKTLDRNLREYLGLEHDSYDNSLMYGWWEGVNENRRHSVAPLVHVMLSEDASREVAERFEFMPTVITVPSTPRGMDWVAVLHFGAFTRPQEFAFTESRGLMRVDFESKHFMNWVQERTLITATPDMGISDILSLPADQEPEPAPLGGVYHEGEVIHWSAHGMTCQVRVPNALKIWRCNVTTGVTEYEAAPELPDHVREALAYMADKLRHIRLRIFYEEGKGLVKILDEADNLLSLTQGVGKDIADVIEQADVRRRKVVEVVPVGTKLKAEFYDLARFITTHRPELGMADIPTQERFGRKEAYHYPPYCSPIQSVLHKARALPYAQELGIVLVTLNEDFSQLIALTDRNGNEISPSRGMGNDIALAFGGVIGQPVKQ